MDGGKRTCGCGKWVTVNITLDTINTIKSSMKDER